MHFELPTYINELLHSGTVIPAHPLALCADGTLDEDRQRRLTRYYLACGVGGLAVGVHTTQFEIRDPSVRLLERVARSTSSFANRSTLSGILRSGSWKGCSG